MRYDRWHSSLRSRSMRIHTQSRRLAYVGAIGVVLAVCGDARSAAAGDPATPSTKDLQVRPYVPDDWVIKVSHYRSHVKVSFREECEVHSDGATKLRTNK